TGACDGGAGGVRRRARRARAYRRAPRAGQRCVGTSPSATCRARASRRGPAGTDPTRPVGVGSMANAADVSRAQGKVILLGEHAVVYGVPALAVGIDRGARASAHAEGEPTLSIDGNPVEGAEVRKAWGALRSELDAPELSVAAELEVPPGSGLGSSAALGVAIARAVLAALGRAPSAEAVLA